MSLRRRVAHDELAERQLVAEVLQVMLADAYRRAGRHRRQQQVHDLEQRGEGGTHARPGRARLDVVAEPDGLGCRQPPAHVGPVRAVGDPLRERVDGLDRAEGAQREALAELGGGEVRE